MEHRFSQPAEGRTRACREVGAIFREYGAEYRGPLPPLAPPPGDARSPAVPHRRVGRARGRVRPLRDRAEQLPPVPFEMRGDFAWIANAPVHDHSIGEANADAVALLRDASARLGLRLPEAFTAFMETPALQQRVRSNTHCFLDRCAEPIRSPVSAGYLVRFLEDSQGCIFWYLI